MIRRLLANPAAYRLHNRLFNVVAVHRRLADDCGYRPGLKVLDVGCGPGTLAAFFRPEDYTGIDTSPEYIGHARRHFGGTFAVLPAERVGEVGGRFDIALMVGVFHHLSDEQVRQTLDGLRRVLKPGGRFRLLEAVWPSRPWDLIGWLLRRLDRGRFVRTRDEWCRLLAYDGWRIDGARITRNVLIEYFECSLYPPTPPEVAP